MRMNIRILTLLSLALPVSLSACSLPLVPLTQEPAKEAAQGQKGSLTIRWTGLSVQALAEVSHLDLSIRVPGANYTQTKRLLSSELSTAMEWALNDLPVGEGEIEAKVFKADASLLKSKRSPIRIDPGKTAHAQLDFYLGGDSATDVELDFATSDTDHFGSLGPYVPDFQEFWNWGSYSYHLAWSYELSGTNSATQSIAFRRRPGNSLERSLDGGSFASLGSYSDPYVYFLYVPSHAAFVADTALPGYPKVRHVRFENVFPTAQGDKALTVDRYYAPNAGLVKEVISEGEIERSVMTLMSYSATFAPMN